jgi:4-hydroxy-tetrahydrodipicolinate synthase
MQLIADGELDVLTGEDLHILTTLCLGGTGAIAASAHVRPDLFVALAEAIAAGELATARRIFYQLRPVIEALFAEPNPAPLKAAMAALGLIHEEVRAPMLTVSPGLRQALGEQVRALELTAAAAR